jgi:hypothetical protein
MKYALKNCALFFGTAIVGMIAIFIFFNTIMPVSRAYAYAIGSVPTGLPVVASVGTAGSNYNIGTSLQNLISPFSGFINSLKFNNNTMINPNSAGAGANGANFTWPTVNLTPILESTIQNTLSQWFRQFDNWLYGVTGLQLSGILTAILGIFSWALGLAQQAVNWLLSFFNK